MKKLYKYIMILFVGIVALSSCVDDNDVFNVGEGNDVVLKLNVKTQENKEVVLGRALDYENDLYDLHFYVFNGQGKLTGYNTFTDADTPTGTVTIPTKTGTSYVYAVANINNGSTYLLDSDDKTLLNVTDVKNSTLTRDYFLTIKYKRAELTGSSQSPTPTDLIFMMSGYLNEGNAVTIQKDGTIAESGIDETIYLYRVLAKNTFNIDLDNSPGFTPKSYKLRNIPLQGMLVRNATYIENQTDAYYDYDESLDKSEFVFYCPENKQGTVSGITAWKNREANSYYTTDDKGQQIYTGEKKFTNAPANSTYVEIHGDYYNKTTTTSSSTPSTTTTTTTSANVSYSIHLGNFDLNHGGSYGDFNVIRNYHYDYKVTVNGVEDIIAEARIENPIDNPYAEGLVIRTTTGQHYDVDAHYEARVMTFDMGDIWTLKDNGKGYILNIETPFGSTIEPLYVKYDSGVKIYALSDNEKAYSIANVAELFNGEADYDWIKFVKNTTANKVPSIADGDIDKYPCRYPGDQWDKTKHSNHNSNSGKPHQPWLNVFEFLAELYNNASETNTQTVYYTCFIEENYYADRNWDTYVSVLPRSIDSRKMQIANNLSVSEDKNSIFADVQYSISQHPIASFYTIPEDLTSVTIDNNTILKNNIMAYGTEIIDEEADFDSRLTGTSNDVNAYYNNMDIVNQHNWNGWTSARNTNSGKAWYTNDNGTSNVLTNIQKIQPLYKAAAKACMSRNRDLNGDGKISNGVINGTFNPDSCEVRWYLASVGQYHGLFFGKLFLPSASWLISDTEMQEIQNYFERGDYGRGNWNNGEYPWKNYPLANRQDDGGSGHYYRGKYHYYTSSPEGSAGTYWPEEGITNNPIQQTWTCRAELVRCVRTLQNDGLGMDNPTRYYEYEDNEFYLYGIDAKRDAITEGNTQRLPNHNELDPQNELYKNFKVAKNTLNSTYLDEKDLDDITGAADDPCSNYKNQNGVRGTEEANYDWRTPNQKELAIMLLEGKWDLTNHTSRTRFSGYQGVAVNNSASNYKVNLVNDLDEKGYHWHDRVGYVINRQGNYNLTDNTNNISIRCVRDVK